MKKRHRLGRKEKISARKKRSRPGFLNISLLSFYFIMMKPPHRFGVLFLFLCLASHATSLTFSWPYSSSPPPPPRTDRQLNEGFIEEESKVSFSIGSPDDTKAMKLLEKVKRKLATPNTCWHRAYNQLFSSCSEIDSSNEKQERLAWMLNDCFQSDSGRCGFPSCGDAEPMMRWPYPFMELSMPWVPLWYLAIELMHIPCFGMYYLIAKANNSFLSKLFPNLYIKSY